MKVTGKWIYVIQKLLGYDAYAYINQLHTHRLVWHILQIKETNCSIVGDEHK